MRPKTVARYSIRLTIAGALACQLAETDQYTQGDNKSAHTVSVFLEIGELLWR